MTRYPVFWHHFPVLEHHFPVLERPFLLCPVLSRVPSRILAVPARPVPNFGSPDPSCPLARFLASPVVPLSWDNEGTSVSLSQKIALSPDSVPSRWKSYCYNLHSLWMTPEREFPRNQQATIWRRWLPFQPCSITTSVLFAFAMPAEWYLSPTRKVVFNNK